LRAKGGKERGETEWGKNGRENSGMEIKQDGTGGQGRRKIGREDAGRKRRKMDERAKTNI